MKRKDILTPPIFIQFLQIISSHSFLEDHAIGLSTFTIMAGLGGSLGYAMGGLDWGVLGIAVIWFQISFSKSIIHVRIYLQ